MKDPALHTRYRILAALGSAVAWWLAFPSWDLTVLAWVALVPLLWLLEEERNRLGYVLGAMTLAYALSCGWVYKAAWIGAIAGVLANALYATLAMGLYRWLRLKAMPAGRSGPWLTWLFWVAPWLAMEYVHQRIDLDFPWMLLGHAPANHPSWIQYYEWTGVGGGTLWLLSVNFWLFRVFQSSAGWRQHPQRLVQTGTIALLILTVPVLVSKRRYHTYSATGPRIEVAAVQPNHDAYQVKFDESTYSEQCSTLVSLSESATKASMVLWPETSVPGLCQKGPHADPNPFLQEVFRRHEVRNTQAWLLGASTLEWHANQAEATPWARSVSGEQGPYYTAYNTAFLLRPGARAATAAWPSDFYHKSRLVIGVEKLPYPAFFKMLSTWISVDLGGMSGQLGRQEHAQPFAFTVAVPYKDLARQSVPKDAAGLPATLSVKVAPMICYESIFGEYCGDFVREGANLLTVMTNDGWWGNTEGHRQHWAYARLRCIEYRRDLLRAANTGISGIFNQKGEVVDSLGWDRRGLVQGKVQLHEELTFYARHGDYLGRLACVATVLFVLMALVRGRMEGIRPV